MKRDFSSFQGKVIFLGFRPSALRQKAAQPIHSDTFEAEAAAALYEIAIRHFGLKAERCVFLAPEESCEDGVQAVSLEPAAMKQTLRPLIEPGDVLLNFLAGVDTLRLAKYVSSLGAHLLSPSLELVDVAMPDSAYAESLLRGYDKLLAHRRTRGDEASKGATCVFAQGATPGLLSQLALRGIEDFAAAVIPEAQGTTDELARELELEAIFLCDRDSQEGKEEVLENVFLNTYSAKALLTESMACTEYMPQGVDSHPAVSLPASEDISGFRLLPLMGCEAFVPAYALSGSFTGMLMRSDEAVGLALHLGLGEDFHPFIGRVVEPCPAARKSIEFLRRRDYVEQETFRLLSDELEQGASELSATLVSSRYGAWSCGLRLELEAAREILPSANAASVQTALGTLAGLFEMLREPERGFLLPEELGYKTLLELDELASSLQSRAVLDSKEAGSFMASGAGRLLGLS